MTTPGIALKFLTDYSKEELIPARFAASCTSCTAARDNTEPCRWNSRLPSEPKKPANNYIKYTKHKLQNCPKIPYDYYKLPYNYYLFLTEFCNATKPYQPRRMNVGISSKMLHHLVCAAPFRGTYQVV
jgi:hypothetical protein